MSSAACLQFDRDTHEYRLPDGRRVPGVTEILAATGISTDFADLAGLSHALADAIERKRDLGTAVHDYCHAFDDDELDWERADPRVVPYVRAWECCRQNLRLHPVARERRVFHPIFEYAGTLDGIFARGLHRVLVDLKLGDPEDAAANFQLAAYEAAWLMEHPDETIDDRLAVQLCPDRSVPYLVTSYRAFDTWQDFNKFTSFLTTYRHQAVRRIHR